MFTGRTIRIAALVALITALLASFGILQAAEQKPALEGTVVFRDAKALSDSLAIELAAVPAPPEGAQYEGFLLGTGDLKTSVGKLQRQIVQGGIVYTFVEPKSQNLVATYGGFTIAIQPSGKVAYSDVIPAPALVHVRHLLYAYDTNPDKKAILVGLRQQADLALVHAYLAVNSATLDEMKLHAEHMVNIIEGSKGPNYGDRNGNGKVDNPGDGRGVLGYAQDGATHAKLALNAAPDRQLIIDNSTKVVASADNIQSWAGGARDNALSILQQSNLSLARLFANNTVQALTWATAGRDADGDGVITGIAGEGGVATAYLSAQDLGGFSLQTGQVATPVTGDLTVPQLALYTMLAGAAFTVLGMMLLRRRQTA